MYCIISEIEKFQTGHYFFEEIVPIREFLENVKGIEENERYGIAKRLAGLKKAATIQLSPAIKLTRTMAEFFREKGSS